VSTHLYHGQRLRQDHLVEIASHGFEAIDLFAARTHSWLAHAGLHLHAVHAPVTDDLASGRRGRTLSLASANADARAHALSEAEQALSIARRIPIDILIVHLGVPRAPSTSPADNNWDAARRSIEELQRLAPPLGVRVGVELIQNELSRPSSLVQFVEEDLETDAGVCLDLGHAHLEGDLLDAIETVSGHLVTAEIHDNHRRIDDHLVPFEGTIDWAAAMTALQKVGYDQTITFELRRQGPTTDILRRAQSARQRLTRLLVG
jgi:sugar phosphate isomerase/epimerase